MTILAKKKGEIVFSDSQLQQRGYPKGAVDSARIIIGVRNLNHIRYADDTVLVAETGRKLKDLLK